MRSQKPEKLLLCCGAKKIWLLPGFKPWGTWYEIVYHGIRELFCFVLARDTPHLRFRSQMKL